MKKTGSQVLTLKGDEALNSGNFDLALKFYEAALEIDPHVGGVWYRLGLIFTQIESDDPSTAQYYFEMSLAFQD
jgi:hypothetical protein